MMKPSFPLLKEKDKLILGPVVVAHPNAHLVPHQWLPELEACLFRHRFDDKHCLCITKYIKMGVWFEHTVKLSE